VLFTPPSILDMVRPEEIAAIELHAIEHDTPSEFRGPNRCGALVVWLRPPDPGDRRPPRWKTLLGALGLVGLILLVSG
jgi:hypothetical protein